MLLAHSIAPGLEWLIGDRLPTAVNLLGRSGPTGQFASSGVFADGPNLYGYAGQSPLMNTDPTGQFGPLVVGAGVALTYLFTPSIANAPGPRCSLFFKRFNAVH